MANGQAVRCVGEALCDSAAEAAVALGDLGHRWSFMPSGNHRMTIIGTLSATVHSAFERYLIECEIHSNALMSTARPLR
jgi:hypothetical protein